ncbi:Fanconi anemia complementation group M [Hibiscus trionum]|uniref:Fanconi anemia complementation group M n=1 Tax=Hibiscus trionum TaxID=183268 RepID=A0A9W7JF41_HIBTR|nr:Fanconi anemia complementation group M [Hibiscus trionum]
MRKQANSRSINKHMQNGGINSFSFHPSPRMIPHIFKPEVQFVELSIDQFVPRGKKLKDDHAIETPRFREKLTVEETDLIAKYFHPTSESTWRPSLIAFPSFQAFPSKICRVMHSYRTEMLIDSMQHLHGLTFPEGNGNFFVEDGVSSADCSVDGIVEQNDSCSKDFLVMDDSPASNSQLGATDSPESPLRTGTPDSGCRSPKAHSCLFDSDFVSVDALGKVLIISVPSLYFEDVMHSKRASTITKELINTSKQDTNCVKTSDEITRTETVLNITSYQKKSIEVDILSTPGFCETDSDKERMLNGVEKIPETPDDTCEMADEANIDLRDIELSPRLTNFIETGVVPESPITDRGLLKQETRNESFIPDKASSPKLHTELLLKSSSPMENDRGNMENTPYGSKVPVMKDEMMHLLRVSPVASTRCSPVSPLVVEMKSPLAKLTDSSSSKSWHLSSVEKAETVEHARVFKRLRKVGDCGKDRSSKSMKENSCVSPANCAKSFSRANPIQAKSGRGKKKPGNDVRTFIDEEAEVSTEAEVSLEEEDDESDSYDDSFIDDRINPTAGSTQIESTGRVDMMAIYRRSLLSQSPMARQPTPAFSPDCIASTSKDDGSGCPSYKTLYSLQAPQPESINQPATKNTEEWISSVPMPCRTYDSAVENESLKSRKRNLSFFQVDSIPAINLEQEFESEVGGKELCNASQQPQVDNVDDFDDDDQFYASLDLDAMEAQATILLKNKSEAALEKQEINGQPNPNMQNGGVEAPPSFDLGIW